MTVSIDRAVLRKLAAGWRPKMTVEVEVGVLSKLLDEIDRLTAVGARSMGSGVRASPPERRDA